CPPKAKVGRSNRLGRANDLNNLTAVSLRMPRALSAVCPRNLFGARSLLLSSTALTPCRAGSNPLGSQLEFLDPPKTTIANPLAVKKQTFSRSEQQALRSAPSLVVDSVRLPRTAATWGITGPELNRLGNAVWVMGLHCKRRRVGLWLATTARATPRDVIADIWKRITRLQGNCGIRQYSVITFEKSGGIHAHIMFLGTRDIAKRLKQARRFGELLDVRPVTDPDGLTGKYLAKERTPQAGYRRSHMFGGRLAGSHRLPGGGDRVRLSRELERDAIEA